jgi:hypothetical protein
MRNALNCTFSLLYSAAELLQVPSSNTKLKGSSCKLCISEVKPLPFAQMLKVDKELVPKTTTYSTN